MSIMCEDLNLYIDPFIKTRMTENTNFWSVNLRKNFSEQNPKFSMR